MNNTVSPSEKKRKTLNRQTAICGSKRCVCMDEVALFSAVSRRTFQPAFIQGDDQGVVSARRGQCNDTERGCLSAQLAGV